MATVTICSDFWIMSLKNAPNSLSISWNTFSPTSLNYSNTDLHEDYILEQHEKVQIWYTGLYFILILTWVLLEPIRISSSLKSLKRCTFYLFKCISRTFHLRPLCIFNDSRTVYCISQPSLSYFISHCVCFASLHCSLKTDDLWTSFTS